MATPVPSGYDTYTSPLAARNASPEMLKIWSPRHKFNTWRRIWLAIAEAQYEVTKDWGREERAPRVSGGSTGDGGPPAHAGGSSNAGPLVTKEQVEELRAVVERGITDDELARASEIERDLRHDVMAHVHCLGESCPTAKPIIHLGCTSQDVVCNADWDFVDQSAGIIEKKLAAVVSVLTDTAIAHRKTPTLGFTHYQAAQPVTVGRRCAGWAYELWITMKPLDTARICNRPRGIRGATGTCASIMKLFNSEPEYGVYDDFKPGWKSDYATGGMTKEDARLAEERYENRVGNHLDWECWNNEYDVAGYYEATHRLTGQTYPRVADAIMLSSLASIAAVLHKIATDIRLLSNRKEIDEPFGKNQIGSSAMPYKRNPMKCERICGLTRFVMNLVGNAYDTAATQWLERTLDDSSNRRLSLPEAFLALDGALDLMHQVASGLVVNEAMVRKNLMTELPFLATENILMEAVKAGGDRQDLHEKIRVHAQAAGHRVKQEGLDNDLIDRLRSDPAFASVAHLLTEDELLDPMKYVGRSVEQTERFLAEVVEPLRERYADELAGLGGSDRGV
ncbi:MAG: lyase family protein [Planctomycetota bacterium]